MRRWVEDRVAFHLNRWASLPVLECPPVLLETTLFNRTLSIRPLLWPDLAEERLRLDHLAATPPGDFLPLGCAHSSRDKKLARLASFATLRPAVPTPSRERDGDPRAGAAPIASGLLIAIEAAMVAGSKTANKENYHG